MQKLSVHKRPRAPHLRDKAFVAGFEVAEFVSRESSLEDVFLKVTRGAVQ